MAPSRLARFTISFLLFFTFLSVSFGQSLTGYPPFNSMDGDVNEGNLNVHLSFPIFSRAGFTYSLTYDNSFWQEVCVSGIHAQCVWEPSGQGGVPPASAYGWNDVIPNSLTGNMIYLGGTLNSSVCSCGYGYQDASNTLHKFDGLHIGVPGNVNNYPQSQTAGTLDGSGYVATFTFNSNGTISYSGLKDANGNAIGIGAFNANASISDPNGHVISMTPSGTTTDHLGQAFTITSTSTKKTFAYTGGNGATSVVVNYSPITYATSFGCTGVNEDNSTLQPVNLPTSIVYPDGSSYQIGYDNFARVNKVTLPTGGVITYAYSGTQKNCGGTVPITVTLIKGMSTDGVNFNNWTYSRTDTAIDNQGGVSSSTTKVIAPNGDETDVQFAYFQETLRKVYTGTASGTPLLQMTHCYNYNSSAPCGTASGPTSQSQAALPPQSLSVLRVFNGGSNDNTVTYFGKLDAYGNRLHLPTEVDSYDFGATTPTRAVITAYGNWNPSTLACSGFSGNILNRVCYQNTMDGAKSTYFTSVAHVYDSYGNVTKTRRFITGSGNSTNFLDTDYAYYPLTLVPYHGVLNSITDANGTTTSFSSLQCNDTFPGSITSSAVSWSISEQWDCNGGVITSRTGPNGANETTTYTYNDPLWRITNVSVPWQNGSTTNISTTYLNANSFYSQQNVNGTSSQQQSLTDLDGLGRPLVKSTLAVGGPYSSVSYQYDSKGRVTFVSNPCLSANYWTPCSGAGTTYSNYDGLNRYQQVTDGGGGYIAYSYYKNDVTQSLYPIPTGETNPKQKHFEYDALGRLTSVCEMTGIAGSGNCPQTYAVNGFLTSYSYDPAGRLLSISQNSQTGGTPQNRSFQYDELGRMTQETNPESGTTTYSYAAYAFCWQAGNDGDMHVRTDAAGNVTCYHYDGLHRLIDAAGWKNNTWYPPYHRYRYDSSSNGWLSLPSGVTVSDVAGRMVETETDGASGTITDEWFSYADSGQMTDLYQSTPNSGGYYHSTASYYENGALSSLSPGITGNQVTVPWNFQLNAYAQPYSQSNSNGTILSSTTYNADGTVATVTHQSGDNEAYSYDGAGRMKQYQFNIGTGPTKVVGNVNWNQNGTLGSLGITDGFVSADTQTCTYGYDDLVRVSSVKCLSGSTNVWNQTFGYDAFANITKTGSISWACVTCYDTTKNQYNSSLSGQISYDANGNLLYDTFHTYAWDANWQNPTSVDSTNLIYDALGRMVEYQTGTTSKQIMYGPTGIVAVMNGQTEVRAFEPYPAGGVFVHQPGSATNYWRHPDWLGSSRFASTEPGRGKFFDVGYAPFGEDYGDSGTKDLSFTGQEQDVTQTVGGLYDFPFRKYAPRQGRWISPDPTLGNVANPQSFNKYAYMFGNPLAGTDPMGFGPYGGVADAWGCTEEYYGCGAITNNAALGAGVGIFAYMGIPTVTSELVSAGSVSAEYSPAYLYPDGSNPSPNTPTPNDIGNLSVSAIGSGNTTMYASQFYTTYTTALELLPLTFGLPSANVLFRQYQRMPKGPFIKPGNNPDWKEEMCTDQSHTAALDKIIPGYATAFGQDYRPATVIGAAGDVAIDQGLDFAAGSTAVLSSVRSWTGLPMSVGSKIFTGIGYLLTAKSLYDGMKAMQQTYKSCMSY